MGGVGGILKVANFITFCKYEKIGVDPFLFVTKVQKWRLRAIALVKY